ncbi:AAA family ATPase [Sphingomonas hankookensis]|uniref:AAA family ATPase n=1 Tax=Sphingomonas hankookensis TaxID=563996 RepID=UPI003F791566
MTTALRGDVDVIQSFLATSLGDAIHLAAITPDGPLSFRWFGSDIAAAASWALEQNGHGRNLYWTVNRVRDGLTSKATKGDVRGARFVLVDVDPPKDGSAWSAAPVLAELTALPSPPSFVIGSGGGVQAFWRLEEESMNLDAIEAINRGVRDRFAGDPCQNIDRLMRVPGTVNWPDKLKVARGRAPALATIVYEDDGTAHDPIALAHRFPAAGVDQQPAAEIVAPSRRVPHITADDPGLSERDPIRATIEHPPADGSRGALACAGVMVRAGYSDEQIEGILLNPTNPVARHCLDQQNPVRAAWRCIQKARAEEERRRAEVEEGGRLAEELGFITAPSAGPLDLDDVADWHGIEVAPREWLADEWLPIGEAALLTGAGAVGKSLAAQQLATCIAAGKPFLGVEVQHAPALYITCEDPRDELQRRQVAIAAAIGVTLQQAARHVKGQELARPPRQRAGELRPRPAHDADRTLQRAARSRAVARDPPARPGQHQPPVRRGREREAGGGSVLQSAERACRRDARCRAAARPPEQGGDE